MPTQYAPTFELVRKRPRAFEQALRILLERSFDDRGERWRASRRLIEMIWWVQDGLTDPDLPPRVWDVRRLLDTIEVASRTLTNRLKELDDLTSDLMQISAPDFSQPETLWEVLDQAQVRGAQATPRDNTSALAENLFALQEACRLLRETYIDGRRPGAPLPTPMTMNPKLQLVMLAAEVFADYRLMDLKATLRGPFHNFCGAIYELITGQDHREHGIGLRRYVDFVAPRARALRGLSERRTGYFLAASSPHFRDPMGLHFYRLTEEMQAAWADLEKGPFKRGRRSK